MEGKGSGGDGETAHHKGVIFTHAPASFCLGCALMGAASVSSRTLEAAWPHNVDAKAAVLRSSLIKLSTPNFSQVCREVKSFYIPNNILLVQVSDYFHSYNTSVSSSYFSFTKHLHTKTFMRVQKQTWVINVLLQ